MFVRGKRYVYPSFLYYFEIYFYFVGLAFSYVAKKEYLCIQNKKRIYNYYGKESVIDDSRWLGNR